MAKANLTVPIIIDWKAIEEYLAQHDIVEVVRCKDCKWQEAENHNCLDMMGYARTWNPDDYCSFGERRDADG